MKNLYLDIETVPAQDPAVREELRASVKAPAQYKKADSIAAWLDENREAEAEAAWLKTSFDGGAGQVVAIAMAVNSGPVHSDAVESLSLGEERLLLVRFFSRMGYVAHCKVIGHNVIAFDLPFLWKRAMVHRLRPPFNLPRNPKPWGELVADTMLMWDPTLRAGGSMDRICRALGIPGKGGITGADVWPLAREGRFADISQYCADDVRRVREMYGRMTFAYEDARAEAEEVAV